MGGVHGLSDGEASCRGNQDLENREGQLWLCPAAARVKSLESGGSECGSQSLTGPREASGLHLQGLRLWGPTFQNGLQGLQDSALVVPHVVVSELKKAVKIFLLVGHVVHEVRGGFPCEIHLPGLELSRAAPDACPRVRGELRGRNQRLPQVNRMRLLSQAPRVLRPMEGVLAFPLHPTLQTWAVTALR